MHGEYKALWFISKYLFNYSDWEQDLTCTCVLCDSMKEVSEGHVASVPKSDPCDPWGEGLGLFPARVGPVRCICN